MAGASDEKKPNFLDRQRAAHPWFDHTVRTGLRYQEHKGDYYAAGITYFTVLALVPILMLAFSIAGFVLAGRPDTIEQIQNVIAENIPGATRRHRAGPDRVGDQLARRRRPDRIAHRVVCGGARLDGQPARRAHRDVGPPARQGQLRGLQTAGRRGTAGGSASPCSSRSGCRHSAAARSWRGSSSC